MNSSFLTTIYWRKLINRLLFFPFFYLMKTLWWRDINLQWRQRSGIKPSLLSCDRYVTFVTNDIWNTTHMVKPSYRPWPLCCLSLPMTYRWLKQHPALLRYVFRCQRYVSHCYQRYIKETKKKIKKNSTMNGEKKRSSLSDMLPALTKDTLGKQNSLMINGLKQLAQEQCINVTCCYQWHLRSNKCHRVKIVQILSHIWSFLEARMLSNFGN